MYSEMYLFSLWFVEDNGIEGHLSTKPVNELFRESIVCILSFFLESKP